MTKQLLLLALTILATGCNGLSKNEEELADETVTEWAEAYFNCRYAEAQKYVTPESAKWLRFVASNMTEADVALLNAQPEHATVQRLSYDHGNDTTAIAYLEVRNYLQVAAIDQQGRLTERGEFAVALVKREGKWLVRMEGLPRSEKQSPD